MAEHELEFPGEGEEHIVLHVDVQPDCVLLVKGWALSANGERTLGQDYLTPELQERIRDHIAFPGFQLLHHKCKCTQDGTCEVCGRLMDEELALDAGWTLLQIKNMREQT